jgi:hypothetical protein
VREGRRFATRRRGDRRRGRAEEVQCRGVSANQLAAGQFQRAADSRCTGTATAKRLDAVFLGRRAAQEDGRARGLAQNCAASERGPTLLSLLVSSERQTPATTVVPPMLLLRR